MESDAAPDFPPEVYAALARLLLEAVREAGDEPEADTVQSDN